MMIDLNFSFSEENNIKQKKKIHANSQNWIFGDYCETR